MAICSALVPCEPGWRTCGRRRPSRSRTRTAARRSTVSGADVQRLPPRTWPPCPTRSSPPAPSEPLGRYRVQGPAQQNATARLMIVDVKRRPSLTSRLAVSGAVAIPVAMAPWQHLAAVPHPLVKSPLPIRSSAGSHHFAAPGTVPVSCPPSEARRSGHANPAGTSGPDWILPQCKAIGPNCNKTETRRVNGKGTPPQCKWLRSTNLARSESSPGPESPPLDDGSASLTDAFRLKEKDLARLAGLKVVGENARVRPLRQPGDYVSTEP